MLTTWGCPNNVTSMLRFNLGTRKGVEGVDRRIKAGCHCQALSTVNSASAHFTVTLCSVVIVTNNLLMQSATIEKIQPVIKLIQSAGQQQVKHIIRMQMILQLGLYYKIINV